MALSSDLLIRALCTETVARDLETPQAALSYEHRVRMATGTATGLADLLFTDTRTLAASGTEDLDVRASLTTPLGQAFVAVRVKAIIVVAAEGNTNNVNVSRPASNGLPFLGAAGDLVPVLPGGAFVWVAPGAGVSSTAGTADLITVTNSAGSTPVTYDVILIGTSA